MRVPLACLAFFAWTQTALAQGAVIESLGELPSPASPPDFRGVLPARIDLSPKLPSPRSQGDTSTCTAWGAVYLAASAALRARGLAPTLTLSPSFAYNQVARDPACQATTKVSTMLDFAKRVGALPIEEFAFDGGFCGRMPTDAELEGAKAFKITGWSAFGAANIDKVKAQLARGVPVVFALRITPNMRVLPAGAVLQEDGFPEEGHVMVAVGYDDDKQAFLVQNSWGRSWAAGGYGWFGYDFWKRNVGVGFVIE